MNDSAQARMFAALAFVPFTTMLSVNVSYLLHGSSRDPASIAAAWVVMMWCAATLVMTIGALFVRPWARRPLVILMYVYLAYYVIGYGIVALRFSPLFVLQAGVFIVLPAVSVWGLSRPRVKAVFARGVA